jgi:7-carboxy-7-deazaguanine synthase
VRLTGCNLRCSYCDTQYAYEEGREIEIHAIIDRVSFYRCPLVEITGGEPLIQKETPALILELLNKGYKVLLETNGTQDISKVDDRCVRIVDLKCPSSGMEDRNDLENIRRLTQGDELKFVIGTEEDYTYARRILDSTDLKTDHTTLVNFSPTFRKLHPKLLAEWILEDHLDVRLNLQIHKYIWDPEQRGV